MVALSCGTNLPLSVGGKIILFLRKHCTDEFNSKLIAIGIEEKDSTVRKELTRLLKAKQPKIVREHHGFYRASTDLSIMRRKIAGKPVLFHSLQLEGICHNKNTKLIFAAISESRKTYRKRDFYRWAFEGRTVSITLYDNGLMQLWLNASTNPLDYMGWQRFRAFLEGRIPEYIGDLIIKQVDVHADIREFQIQEFQGMRLKVFDNAWLHLYQKTEDLLRLEVSMVPRELKFVEACEIIRSLVSIPTEQTYQAPPEDTGAIAYR